MCSEVVSYCSITCPCSILLPAGMVFPSCHSIWQHCSSLLLGIGILFSLAQGHSWYASGEEKELQILCSCSNNPLTFFSPFHPKGRLTHVKPAGCLFSLGISGETGWVVYQPPFQSFYVKTWFWEVQSSKNSKKARLSFNRNLKG